MAPFTAQVISTAFEAAWSGLDSAVAAGHLTTAVLAIGSRDEIIQSRSIGSGAEAAPVQSDSIFLLASITKPVVATGILQLVEKGALLLHEPVANHWPEFGINGKQSVTLWHLLTHTSGLDENARSLYRPGSPAELRAADAALVARMALRFPPGSRYTYCSASFRVMAVLIERLTGQDYVSYLQEHVLGPAGMVDTTFDPGDRPARRVVPASNVPFPADAMTALALPGAGYWSTAPDLIAFGQSFLRNGDGRHGRVLGPAMAAAATRVQYQGNSDAAIVQPAVVYRGLGFQVFGPASAELVPPGTYGHGGATGTRLWIDPVNDLVGVFLTNGWGVESIWRDRAINAFYGQLGVV